METFKFQMISKQTIKPSSPTPPNLKTFNLSLLDQLAPPIYMPCIFFYKNFPKKETNYFSHQLKSSLSKTLTKYYPFAGRLVNGATIDCNDEGVEFFEAQMHCQLLQILQNPEDQILTLLFPKEYLWLKTPLQETSLLGVQLTYFDCGGIAVSLNITHKIADGFGQITFINDWAATSLGREIYPTFIATSTTQPIKKFINVQELELEKSTCVTKRFVFCPTRLALLKARGIDFGLKTPSRVELVTALLYKCAIFAAESGHGSSRNSSLIHLVNMRTRLTLPFPKNSIGNFAWYFTISAKENNEKSFENLVHQLKKGMAQLCLTDGENKKFEAWITEVGKSVEDVKELFEDTEIYRCSSMCKAPFYEVDFGCGKPLWVRCIASNMFKNLFLLMDTRDGDGIEAFVTLEEGEMNIFQQDEELLAFASLNPSPI